jgi:ankyrin repeat protein
MKIRARLGLLVLAVAMSSVGCGIFFPSHHDTLDYKPIHAAAEGGDLATVQELIKNDPHLVEAEDWDNLTPLHLAVMHGHKDVAEFLLAHGAKVNAKTVKAVTPLHMAAQTGNIEIMQLLMSSKAAVNPVDSSGWTPLVRAQKWGHPEAVEYLRQHGGHE